MFSRPKILFLVSLLFVALLNSIPTYLLNFQFFYQSINKATKAKLKRKFDVAYMIVKENLSFTKMSICELEERHGTDLGTGYKNDHSCATFVEFISREQLESLITTVVSSVYKPMAALMLEIVLHRYGNLGFSDNRYLCIKSADIPISKPI